MNSAGRQDRFTECSFCASGAAWNLQACRTLTIGRGALQQASAAITELGGAKAGDRTMLDALDAFVQELKGSSAGEAHERLLGAVAAAQRGADATANMTPRLGRSSYLRDRVLGHPDPGAEAVALWLRAAVTAVLQD
jgi:dihydroxyacetone kinase